MSESPSKLPLRKALSYIFLSIFLVSGSAYLGVFYYKHIREKQRHDSAYKIVAIIQSTPSNEKFKTVYLAELLGLSVDRPTNLYRFNTNWAQQQLLASPVIKKATVAKINPGTIFVDYTPRRPIAFLADYTNTAVDEEKIAFPFNPFFTPKRLPEIYLEKNNREEILPDIVWGAPIRTRQIDFAFALLELVNHHCCDSMSSLSRIDVSAISALSYGQRQIVLIFEERIPKMVEGAPILWTTTHLLRLSPDNYHEQLANYLVLRTYLREHEKPIKIVGSQPGSILKGNRIIIDLRLSELAFITKEQ